ncbi:MAG: DUF1127 domain-containing protein [Paracoccaceae bacterium]|nr:DUF1127 domain-containing protein [Paracoccaceae bacterium]
MPTLVRLRPPAHRSNFLAWLALAHRRWRSRAALARLEPDLLADIGISRAEARVEARRPFWR